MLSFISKIIISELCENACFSIFLSPIEIYEKRPIADIMIYSHISTKAFSLSLLFLCARIPSHNGKIFFAIREGKRDSGTQPKNADLQLTCLIRNDKPLPIGRIVIVQGESRFTRQEIESGSASLAVLVALEVVLVIVIILRDRSVVPVIVADISRDETVAGWTSLSGLSDAGPMIITEEDRRRRRRRQLRALKATLKVTGQERLYRVCLRRAWKTERETRSRDQSTTSSRFYNIPLSPYIRILTLSSFPSHISSRFFTVYFSFLFYSFFFSLSLSSVFSHFSAT